IDRKFAYSVVAGPRAIGKGDRIGHDPVACAGNEHRIAIREPQPNLRRRAWLRLEGRDTVFHPLIVNLANPGRILRHSGTDESFAHGALAIISARNRWRSRSIGMSVLPLRTCQNTHPLHASAPCT